MSAGYTVGDPLEITAGGAQVLLNQRDAGYCQGKLGMSREVENLIVKVGIPRTTVLQLLLGEDYKLEIPMIQVANINNLGTVMGIPPRSQTGATGAVAFGTAATASTGVYTFATQNGSDLSFIQLGHPNVENLVVKSVDEVTTYLDAAATGATGPTDYAIVNAASGLVARMPDSAFAIGATVHVAYDYTTVSFDELLLGKSIALQNYQVEYLHLSPQGFLLHYCFWKCQGDGSIDMGLDSGASAPMIALAKMTAQNDEANHPSSATQGPTGFIRVVPSALVTAYLATVTIIP